MPAPTLPLQVRFDNRYSLATFLERCAQAAEARAQSPYLTDPTDRAFHRGEAQAFYKASALVRDALIESERTQ